MSQVGLSDRPKLRDPSLEPSLAGERGDISVIQSRKKSSTLLPILQSRSRQPYNRVASRPAIVQQSSLIDITDDDSDICDVQDYMTDDQFRGWITQQVRPRRTRRVSSPKPLRNLPISAPFVSLASIIHNGIKLNPKANVELQDGRFMRLIHIIKNTVTSDITLRGWTFQRTKELNGVLEKKLNEVCWILHLNEDDAREAKVQGMESIPVGDVVRRRAIRLTNQDFPALSFREEFLQEDEEKVSRERVLVCRFKYICCYQDAKARDQNNKWSLRALHRLKFDECDPSCGIEDDGLRRAWRGDTVAGGSCKRSISGEEEFLLQERTNKGVLRRSSTHGPFFNGSSPVQVGSLITELDLLQNPDETSNSGSQAYFASPFPTIQAQDRRRRNQASHWSPGIPVTMRTYGGEKSLRVQSRSQKMLDDLIDLTDDEPSQDLEVLSTSNSIRSAHYSRLSIEPHRSLAASPDIVEIKAEVKLSSSMGTTQHYYEGRLTSTYSPKSPHQQRRKRSVEQLRSPSWPSHKRHDTGHTSRNPMLSPVDSDKDQTFGRSPSIASLEEIKFTPRSLDQTQTPISNQKSHKLLSSHPSLAFRKPPKPKSEVKTTSVYSALDQSRYTFGDSFCGAGGMSRGAVMAGLRVEWGFDFDPDACKSYALNFYGTKTYLLAAHQFAALDKIDHKVDILHLSPPCQYFSDAHTTPGRNDEMNTASLFAVHSLLTKAKPRVVTLEQTSGLPRRHPAYFNSLIQMFTAQGFSVQWKIFKLADYGLAQSRKRVFIIASW